MGNYILINASNLHGGGGVQVAVSIVDELSRSDRQANVALALSSTVRSACETIGTDLSGFRDLVVIDVRGFDPVNASLDRLFQQAEVVFTIFGPLYSVRRPKKSVVGFAQAWILYPQSDAYYQLPRSERLKVRAKYFFQKLAFRRNSDLLIVEANHVRERLEEVLPHIPTIVVPNALNAVFLRSNEYLPNDTLKKVQIGSKASDTKNIILGFVGRAYSHKNINVLPGVRKVLRERYGVDATIKVTLNDDEWAAQTEVFRSEIENVGSMSLKELVKFYCSLDGVVFPSLLECFSVTPLEAMAMGLPLYASDRTFVRDSCEEFPFYFDPLDPASIADAVGRSFALPDDDLEARLQAGRTHVLSLPTATERAQKMVELLLSL